MSDSRSQTRLARHKKRGTALIPPMAEIPNMTPLSWSDERLPELLWAAVLVTAYPRDVVLPRFENIVDVACELVSDSIDERRKLPIAVTQSGMALLTKKKLRNLLEQIAPDDETCETLSCLLLLEGLPGRDVWKSVLGRKPSDDGWGRLAVSVGTCFFHQSQEATDCRWVKVLFAVQSELVKFASPEQRVEMMIDDYARHDEEKLKKSRPMVRAMEIGLDTGREGRGWAARFWEECYEKTGCMWDELSEAEIQDRMPTREQIAGDRERLGKMNQELLEHFWESSSTSGLDPRHEVAFGIAMYCADIVTSAIALQVGRSAQGRMTLRTLAESLISLKYLAQKDDPSVWLAYRKHGEGQAKLVCQRAEEEQRVPSYLDMTSVGQIANDDVWVEFLPIKIGNWDASNLRKMAESVGLKEIYDDYYTWPSSYTHGLFGAIRESMYQVCGNPLHRLHRIPRMQQFDLLEVREDLYILLDKVLDILYEIYPKEV